MAAGSLGAAEKLDWLRLIRTENVGPITFHELLERFGTAGAALEAIPGLRYRGGMRRPGAIYTKADAMREMEAAEAHGVAVVAFPEGAYPPLLKQIEAPPPILFTKGATGLAARGTIAIVGSRSASSAGQQFAANLARDLGGRGYTIVSGLARGIDTAAHKGSLATGTVAVLAGGLDIVYPPENAALHAAIAAEGLLVSERPIGFAPRGQDFPRRNRIISGLSSGAVVVEAARSSGSLITARLAAEQNREVFAVPGHPLDPRSAGTNELIRNGAHLLTSAGDVFAELPFAAHGRELREAARDDPLRPGLSEGAGEPSEADRQKVLEALSLVPVHADTLVRDSGLSARTLAIVLLELDLAGRIERHGNQQVSLKPEPE